MKSSIGGEFQRPGCHELRAREHQQTLALIGDDGAEDDQSPGKAGKKTVAGTVDKSDELYS